MLLTIRLLKSILEIRLINDDTATEPADDEAADDEAAEAE